MPSGLLPLVGRKAINLPAAANIATPAGKVTAVVTQHLEDGIENGHEAMFLSDAVSGWLDPRVRAS